MIPYFQLREDYGLCEYPAWFLSLCQEYEIDFNYVKTNKTHWLSLRESVFFSGNISQQATMTSYCPLLWCVWWEAVVQKWFCHQFMPTHTTTTMLYYYYYYFMPTHKPSPLLFSSTQLAPHNDYNPTVTTLGGKKQTIVISIHLWTIFLQWHVSKKQFFVDL